MRTLSRIFMALSALCLAVPAFAQGGSAETNWVAITAGFSMAIASAVCGLAQGKAVAVAVRGYRAHFSRLRLAVGIVACKLESLKKLNGPA